MAEFTKIKVRLVCRTMPEVPPEEGPLDVGIQDKSQTVHAGKEQKDGVMFFECDLEAKLDDSTGGLAFRGPFVHGTPDARFLYLSWKRRDASRPPWYWRVKVPLSGIPLDNVSLAKPDDVLEADITNRRPHVTDPIIWKLSRADVS
jgi:hypothetical protein